MTGKKLTSLQKQLDDLVLKPRFSSPITEGHRRETSHLDLRTTRRRFWFGYYMYSPGPKRSDHAPLSHRGFASLACTTTVARVALGLLYHHDPWRAAVTETRGTLNTVYKSTDCTHSLSSLFSVSRSPGRSLAHNGCALPSAMCLALAGSRCVHCGHRS